MRRDAIVNGAVALALLCAVATPRAHAGESDESANAAGPTPVWDDCGFEPWDPVLNAPRAPNSAKCTSVGYFRVDCGSDPCTSLLHLPPIIETQRMEVVAGKCVQRGQIEFVSCDQIVELRLLPPACPDPATSPRTAVVTTPDGIVHIAGETLRLTIDFDFSCGTFHCDADPQQQDDPSNPGQPLLCAPKAPRCKVAPCELPHLTPLHL